MTNIRGPTYPVNQILVGNMQASKIIIVKIFKENRKAPVKEKIQNSHAKIGLFAALTRFFYLQI